MTIEKLFDNIVEHYKNAQHITELYKADNIFRVRQHTISSIIEDGFAYYLNCHLKLKFPDLPIYIMVDYAIRPDNIGEKMIPDIAIIIDQEKPVLASYLDLKTDLGYKRDYHVNFSSIHRKVDLLRNTTWAGTKTREGRKIAINPNLVWRTIVISDMNISSILLDENKAKSITIADYFNLYFLSGNSHPNRKVRDEVFIYHEVVDKLMKDIEQDISSALVGKFADI